MRHTAHETYKYKTWYKYPTTFLCTYIADRGKKKRLCRESLPLMDMKAVHIGEGIWMGNILSLQDLPLSFTVISLLTEEKLVHLSKRLMQDNRRQINWSLPDKSSSAFLCNDLIQILNVMDNSRPILVHCARGVSRSAAVCAAWFISRHHCSTLQDSMALIRQATPTASPNLGFIAALKAIERNDGDVEAALHQWTAKQKVGHKTTI
jgi:protein-tyrosine phosphatase